MLVPVLALLLLNLLQIAPTIELKTALTSFTGAGAAALGHGFIRDARAVAAAKRRSKAMVDSTIRVHEATCPGPAVVQVESAAASHADTVRREVRADLHPEEST